MASWSSIARASKLAAVVLAAVFVAACRSEPPLPSYATVPQFQLTAQTGAPFDSRSLAGKIWVAISCSPTAQVRARA